MWGAYGCLRTENVHFHLLNAEPRCLTRAFRNEDVDFVPFNRTADIGGRCVHSAGWEPCIVISFDIHFGTEGNDVRIDSDGTELQRVTHIIQRAIPTVLAWSSGIGSSLRFNDFHIIFWRSSWDDTMPERGICRPYREWRSGCSHPIGWSCRTFRQADGTGHRRGRSPFSPDVRLKRFGY